MVTRMQFDYSSQNNIHLNDTESPAAKQSISQFHVEVSIAESRAALSTGSGEIMLKKKTKKTLVAVIYRVYLLKDA